MELSTLFMSSPREFLNNILTARKLNKPSGEPLYSYKVSNDEYINLQSIIQSSVTNKDISTYAPKGRHSDWAAAFVLYASEWWRREFSGGSWSWSPILQSLHADETELNAEQRNKIIEAGFRFWHRPLLVNSRGRMFLATVSVEGGLPLSLITQDHSKIGHYFDYVIKEFGKYSFTQHSAESVAIAGRHLLVSSYQVDAVYSVVGKLVEAIYNLTEQFALDEQAEPIAYLNAVEPNWQSNLPINLDSSVTKELLNSVLGKAIAVQRKLPDTIKIIRSLINTQHERAYVEDDPSKLNESWRFKLDLSLRSRVNANYIKQLFAIDELPKTLNLFVIGKKPQLVAKGFMPKNSEQYLFEVFRNELPDEWFDSEIQLNAKTDDGRSWFSPLIGGGALELDEPWAFVDKPNNHSQEYIFVGSGDVATENEHSIVAFNNNITDSSQNKLTSFFKTSGSFERQLYALEKPGDYTANVNTITLGGKPGYDKEYLWQGSVLPFQSKPSKCFIGKPILFELDKQSVRKVVSSNHLKWRDKQNEEWLTYELMPFGQNIVKYSDCHKINKRFTVAHLPADFTIDIIPGCDVSTGIIRISSNTLPTVSTVNSKQTSVHCEQELNVLDLAFTAHEEYLPAKVELTLAWGNSAGSISLIVPFPSAGVSLIDRDDFKVKNHSDLAVEELYGYELFGHGLKGSIILLFTLQARDIKGAFGHSAYYEVEIGSIDDLENGMSISTFLGEINKLFSLSAALDAKVKFSVIHNGKEILRFGVLRYALTLSPERNENKVRISNQYIENVSLFTKPIDRPEQEPIELVKCVDDNGCWLFPEDEVEPGAWLVFCNDVVLSVRPLMWSKALEKLGNPENEFQRIAGLPSQRDRIASFGELAGQMSINPSMTEWKFSSSLLNFNAVPLVSFDLWRGVSASPEFLFAQLFNVSKKQLDDVWKFDNQFPILRYAILLKKAIAVVESKYESLISRLDEDEYDIAQGRIEQRLALLVAYNPSLSSLNNFLLYKIGVSSDKPTIEPSKFMAQLFELRNALSTRHSSDKWPTDFCDELFKRLIDTLEPSFKQALISINGVKSNVLNAPILLALATAEKVHVRSTAELVNAIRNYRDFDPEYFDNSFALTQKLFLSSFSE
jgi:hypothetical protein